MKVLLIFCAVVAILGIPFGSVPWPGVTIECLVPRFPMGCRMPLSIGEWVLIGFSGIIFCFYLIKIIDQKREQTRRAGGRKPDRNFLSDRRLPEE